MFFNKNLQLQLYLKPSLNCSQLVLNFWANLSLVVLIKKSSSKCFRRKISYQELEKAFKISRLTKLCNALCFPGITISLIGIHNPLCKRPDRHGVFFRNSGVRTTVFYCKMYNVQNVSFVLKFKPLSKNLIFKINMETEPFHLI